MKKVVSIILAILFFLIFVIQASMIAFAASAEPPVENASIFEGPYTCPPDPMDEYSFSYPAVYDAIRMTLVTNKVSGVTLRSDSISTLVTDQVETLEVGELDGAALTEDDIRNIVAYFPNLKVLKLENCYITSIPKEIENLTSLNELHLSDNNIIDLNNVDFTKLTSLNVLELNDNEIKDITPLFNMESLKVLKLSNNAITSEMIPVSVSLPNLEELDMSYNELTYIPISFETLQSLKCLYLNNNKITSIPSMYLQNLTIFDVSNNEFLSPTDCFSKLKDPSYRKSNFLADILSMIRKYNFNIK